MLIKCRLLYILQSVFDRRWKESRSVRARVAQRAEVGGGFARGDEPHLHQLGGLGEQHKVPQQS